MNSVENNSRPFSAILSELKEETKEFVQTRIEMLKSELREKASRLKIAAPLAAFGLLLLATAYLLITLGIVAVVAVAFSNSEYQWVFAFLGVGMLWAVLGTVAAYFAKRELELKSMAPTRTIELLRQDKIWLQREAKNQI
jgi:uncharacterized membrane protein YqjE